MGVIVLYFASIAAACMFYSDFTGHRLERVLPLVVLSALYTPSVSDFVLLLFSVDK